MTRSTDGPGPGDQAELERLRAEVAALRDRSSAPRWRSALGLVLIGLGSILLLPATVAVWLDSVVTDTDRYVATVSPLADDAAVQAAVTERVTDEVATAIDAETLVEDMSDDLALRGVSDRATTALRGLSGPLASGLKTWLDDQVATVVRSDAFAGTWTRANRAAHTQLVGLLTDDPAGGALAADGDRVSIELGPVVDEVKERLVARGVGVAECIPAIDSRIVLVESEHVDTARRGFALIDGLGLWLSVLALTLVVAGVLVAADLRRALVQAGMGAVAAMVALGIVLAVARPVYLDALPDDVDGAAAAAVFDQVVGFLRTTLRAVLVGGVLIAAAAYLTGPSSQAAAVRSGLRRAGSALDRRGWRSGAVALSVRRHRRPVQVLIVMVAVVVFVFWDYLSGAVVASIASVAAALAVLVEIFAAPDGASDDLREGDQERDADQEQDGRPAQYDPGQGS